MLKVYICAVLMLIVLYSVGNAATVALRNSVTQESNFETVQDEPFEIEIFIDPQGETIVGVWAFLSFDNRFLALVDAAKPVMPDDKSTWEVFDNDTHNDPGNGIPQFQIDYVYLTRDPAEGINTPVSVGRVRFRPLRPTQETVVRFDVDAETQRQTELLLQTTNTRAPEMIPTRIVIKGAPVIAAPFPSVVILTGQTETALDLDDFVADPNDSSETLRWEVQAGQHINAVIEPETHTVTLEAPSDWVGEEALRFTVTDPSGNTASADARVTVQSPPVIGELLPLQLRVGEAAAPIDLNAFVSDLDDPELVGLVWTLAQEITTLQISLDGSLVTVQSDTIQAETPVAFVATDADGHSTTATLYVTVLGPSAPPVITPLPAVSFPHNQTHQALDLDDHVSDEDTPIAEIQWEVEGQVTVEVEIDPESHRVSFASLDGTVTREEITFIARDPEGNSASAVLLVSVVEALAPEPPILAELPALSIRASEIGTRQVTLLLTSFVTDSDTPLTDLVWGVAGTDSMLAVEIDATTQIATFRPAEGFISEKTVTFTVADPEGGSAEAPLTFSVIDDRPKPPVIKGLPAVVTLKGEYMETVINLGNSVSDPDTPTSALMWSVSEAVNLKVTIEPNTHHVAIVPNPGFLGTETLVFTVVDPTGLYDEREVKIQVTPPEAGTAPPVLVQSPTVVLEVGGTSDLHLDGLVSDDATPDGRIQWRAEGQRRVRIIINPATRIAELSLAEDAHDFRGVETFMLIAVNPSGGRAQTQLSVIVQDTSGNAPPSFDIFIIPNPIQPAFLTLAVMASEPLRAKPTVTADGKFVEMSLPVSRFDHPSTEGKGAAHTWTGVYMLPKSHPGHLQIHVKGVNLSGVEGERERTFVLDDVLAAPAKPLDSLTISTYPNPVRGNTVWLECALNSPATLTVFIYTVDGRLVKTMVDEEFLPVPGRLARRCEWNLADDLHEGLVNGIYYCYGTARTGERQQTHCWKMTVKR